MDQMNPVLAGIYGTGGHEKVASEGGHAIETLSDLAVMIVTDGDPEQFDMEKDASAHEQVYNDLVAYDRAGRAMAQHEFTEMEKEAAAGNPEALEAFFADMLEDEGEGEDSAEAISAERQAVLAELQRRLA